MPRTLPWLTGDSDVKKEKKRQSTPRGGRIKPDPPRRNAAAESKQTPVDSADKRDFFRSSQTPTSPVQQCPSEEFLIEGLDNDDIYIMVEDEFYAVAQTFTQHLHYAEYVRRTKEAKAQNATAIRNLERPTDDKTPMSDALRRKKASEALRSRQNTGLDGMVGKRPRADSSSDGEGAEEEGKNNEEDNEDEEMWSGTHLYDLMTSPRKARALVGLQGIRSSTRAAAGYAQSAKAKHQIATSPEQMERGSPSPVKGQSRQRPDEEIATSDEDGDLDARPNPAIGRTIQKPSRREDSTRKLSTSNATLVGTKKSHETRNFSTESKYSTPVRSSKSRRSLLLVDDFDPLPDDMDMDIKHATPNVEPSIRRRPSQNDSRAKVSEPKKSRLNEVPTFLV